jgi:hypothetical protein
VDELRDHRLRQTAGVRDVFDTEYRCRRIGDRRRRNDAQRWAVMVVGHNTKAKPESVDGRPAMIGV